MLHVQKLETVAGGDNSDLIKKVSCTYCGYTFEASGAKLADGKHMFYCRQCDMTFYA